MIPGLELPRGVAALAAALGIIERTSAGARLRSAFFEQPAAHLRATLAEPAQRAALLEALAALLPAAAAPPAPPGGARYRVLGDDRARLDLVLAPTEVADTLRLAVIAEARAAAGPAFRAELPLVDTTGASAALIAGTPRGPLRIELDVPIDSAALQVSLLVVAPPDAERSRLALRLDRRRPDGTLQRLELDPGTGAGEVGRLIAALLELLLEGATPPGSQVPPALRPIEHLLHVLGLAGSLPEAPLGHLDRPGAIRDWLAELARTRLRDGRPALAVWLAHVGQLLGQPVAAPSAALPSEDCPFELLLAEPGGARLHATVAVREAAGADPATLVVSAVLRVPAAIPGAALTCRAVLLELPLAGSAPVGALASIEAAIEAAIETAPLWPPAGADPQLAVGAVRAGLRFAQGRLAPLLELRDVTLGIAGATTSFARLDLSSTNTLAATAASALRGALDTGLGPEGTPIDGALRLLLGLGAGAGEAIDPVLLASAPREALAAYHRRLCSTRAGWARLLGSVAVLVGAPPAPGPLEGAGTAADPYRIALPHLRAPTSPVAIAVAAWTETGADLHLGLRVEARGSAPLDARWSSWSLAAQGALVVFDLDGATSATAFGGAPSIAIALRAPAGGWRTPTFSLEALELIGRSRPGTPLACRVDLRGVTLHVGMEALALGDLSLPAPAPRPERPDLGLGLDPAQLWRGLGEVLRRRGRAWAGSAGEALLGCLGLGRDLDGTVPGAPALELPGGDLGALLRDPLAAVRAWLARLALADAVGASGTPFLPALRAPLQALLRGGAAPRLGDPSPPGEAPPRGEGRREHPWAIPLELDDAPRVELLSWLEPAGAPVSWTEAIRDALAAPAPSAHELLRAAAALPADLGDVLLGRGLDTAAGALTMLAAALAGTDGLVSVDDAAPGGAWAAARPVVAPHHLMPQAAAAVEQIAAHCRAQVAAQAPAAWALVLAAPWFAGDRAWDPLIAELAPGRVERVTLGPDALGALGAAPCYIVTAPEPAVPSLRRATDELLRVIARVRELAPGARVMLVAHSILGVAAQQLAHEQPDGLLGIVALGAPLRPAVPGAAACDRDGIHLSRGLARAGLPGAPALEAALAFLGELDHGLIALPLEPFTWAPPDPPPLHGVPALAIAGAVEDDLVGRLASAVRAAAPDGHGQAPAEQLRFGLRVGLALPAALDGEPAVDATLRIDLDGASAIALAPGSAADTATARLTFRAELSRPGGWLVGPGDPRERAAVHVRAAVLEVAAGGGAPRLSARMIDTRHRDRIAPIVDLDTPGGEALLAALLEALARSAAPGGRLGGLLDVLEGIELLRRDAGGALVFAGDGFARLRTDAAAALAVTLPRLLARPAGLLGLVADPAAPAAGPWTLALGRAPLHCAVHADPWRLLVSAGGAGLELAGGGRLRGSCTIAVADLRSRIEGRLDLPGLSVERAPGPPSLRVSSPWLEAPAILHPADPDRLLAALAPVVPRVIADAAIGELVELLLGSGVSVGPVSDLFVDAPRWLARAQAFGDGRSLSAARLNEALAAVATAAGLATAPGAGLVLPGGIAIAAIEAATGVGLALRTIEPLRFPAGAAGAQASVALHLEHAARSAPRGGIELRLPVSGRWGSVDLSLGSDGDALRVAVGMPGIGKTVQLLPAVSGLHELIETAAVQRLLPAVLDLLVEKLGADPGSHPLLPPALALAEACGVYEPAAAPGTRFQARADQLAALIAQPLPNAAAAARALRAVLDAAVPGLVGAATGPTELVLALGSAPGAPAPVELRADLDPAHPALVVTARDLALDRARATVEAGGRGARPVATLALAAALDPVDGIPLRPRLVASLDSGGVGAVLYPLGDDHGVVLAPAAAPPPATASALATAAALELGIPIAAAVLLRHCRDLLDRPLWSAAPAVTARAILASAGLIDEHLVLQRPLPRAPALLSGVLRALAGLAVPMSPGVRLELAEGGDRALGLRLAGEAVLSAGDPTLALALGAPPDPDGAGPPDLAGVALVPQDTAGPMIELLDGAAAAPAPVVRIALGGAGVRVRRPQGPLVETAGVRIGDLAAHLLGTLDAQAGTVDRLGLQIAARDLRLGVAGSQLAVDRLEGSFLETRAGGYGAALRATGVHLQLGGGDGVLGELLSTREVKVDLAGLGVAWSSDAGVSFAAQGGATSFTIPIGLSLGGGVELPTVTVALRAGEPLPLAVRATILGRLGPVALAIDGVGVGLALSRGTDGAITIDAGVLPPEGVGLSLRTGLVEGSGFLGHRDGTYQGAFSVTVKEVFRLSAVGIITTRMPDGSEGCSFKVLGRADFEAAPIQIGMGFAIVGLGGLIAINCRMDEAVLRDMVYAGTLHTLLFPEDLGRDAPAVLAALDRAFPPSRGSYTFGALARIVWGAGIPLFRADVGVLVELGGGIEVALPGVATLQLPNPDAPIVRIRLQLLGLIDFEAQTLSLDARLFDSQLAGFPIEGAAALRCSWGERPRFAFAVGGFHPRYAPPPGFPALERMTLVVARGNPDIGLSSYLAITESSCQLGAELSFRWSKPIDLWVGKVTIELSGSAGFDVVVAFQPSLHFHASLYSTFSLEIDGEPYMGLELRLSLDGPNPYHLRGLARPRIWRCSVELEIDHRFGEELPEPTAPCSPRELLEAEIRNPASWTIAPRPGYASGVVVVPEVEPASPRLDPVASTVTFVQRVVPLRHGDDERTWAIVSRVGKVPAARPYRYDLHFTGLGAQLARPPAPQRLRFAPGDFSDLDDERALASDLELHGAGYQLLVDGLEVPEGAGDWETCEGLYERPQLRDANGDARTGSFDPALAGAVHRASVRRFTHDPLDLARPRDGRA